ncbi:MAG: hypothetical protein Q4C67_07510 [Deinococcus sp.]|nr:hypothetical protein [Deinococcus sp.]
MKDSQIQLRGFRLTVTGYEFPEISPAESYHDANWLTLRVDIRTGEGGLHSSEACLLTWELRDLAEQLELLSEPQQHRRWQAQLKPLEPYLKLRFLQDETGLFFTVRLMVHTDESVQSFKVQWKVQDAELEEFRTQLNHLLRLFPIKEQP